MNNKPWAALVERGGKCGFVDKVKNMMDSGASAVIVGDYQKGPLITMYSDRGKSLTAFFLCVCVKCDERTGRRSLRDR